MKLTPSREIAAPLDATFDGLLHIAARQGAGASPGAWSVRTDTLSEPGAGMSWHLYFDLRGHRREADLQLTESTRPQRMCFEGRSPGLDIQCTANLVALAPARTRLDLEIHLRPLGLSGRLFVQSLKLAKYRITKRLEQRLGGVMAAIENRSGS